MAFTAAQIPNIEHRRFPAELAGSLYPEGIPLYPESELARLITDLRIDLMAFSYRDVSHSDVMHRASMATARGADFVLIGATCTMPRPRKPVPLAGLIPICVQTDTGHWKSPLPPLLKGKNACGF
jgi:predicted GTPase